MELLGFASSYVLNSKVYLSICYLQCYTLVSGMVFSFGKCSWRKIKNKLHFYVVIVNYHKYDVGVCNENVNNIIIKSTTNNQ